MSEENETPEELLFYDDGIPLGKNYWGGYVEKGEETQTKALQAKIEQMMAAGEPIYVQILDERRKGSVGRLNSITMNYQEGQTSRWSYSRSNDYFQVSDLSVVWDGRKNKCSPTANEVEYLPDWEGPTQWNWTPGEAKEKPPRVVPYDSLGQEIEPGLFVCFVHRLYGHISMKFGTVTRLTDKGGVFVKTLKLRDGERAGEELKAFEAQHLLIVNDKLMGRLMMARLSAD